MRHFYLNRKYFLEIKFKIFYSFLMYFITVGCCYYQINPLLYKLSAYLLIHIKSNRFFFNNFIEIFFMYFEFAASIAFFIAIPFMFLNIFLFFISSLLKAEFKFYLHLICLFFFYYFLSFFFVHLICIPFCIDTFLIFEFSNKYFPLHFEAKFEDYFKIILKLQWICLLFFQLPTLNYCYKKKDILKWLIIKKNYVYIFFFITSALLSPPDFFYQFILFINLSCLFECYLLYKIFFKHLWKKIYTL